MKSAVTSALLLVAVTLSAAPKPPAKFNVVEASISEMQAALKDGR